jgi:hypothetical protein
LDGRRPDRLTLDATVERYTMRGRWRQDPAAAYADAEDVTVGATLVW